MKTKYIKLNLIICSIVTLTLSNCSKEETLESDPFVVAFESLSKNLMDIESDETISLVYSEMALDNGSVSIQIVPENAIYGIDFTTIPEASANIITLPITSGEVQNSILFRKLNTSLDEITEIEFEIISIDYNDSNVQGNSSFLINASASLGGSFSPEVGGPNQGNQVYVDLSSQSSTLVQRDSWDLGFYNGNDFRVTLNGSIFMAAKALASTNIDLITQDDVSAIQSQVAVGTFDPDNSAYIDAPNGNIMETAIEEVSLNDNENQVYLLNLGYEVGTDVPNPGSVSVVGDHRGWKKIRILRRGEKYILQHANLNDNTHQEIAISKNSNFNFNHFSFISENLIQVEPQRKKWDLCFTVFTNIINGAGSYGFSDFVYHNRKGNAMAYMVNTSEFQYENFEYDDIIESNFSSNQDIIGSSWRSVFEGTAFDDRFYIIRDPNQNFYKIKFLGLNNNDGIRGYPEFQYKLLQ
jgi:hypothetical protein